MKLVINALTKFLLGAVLLGVLIFLPAGASEVSFGSEVHCVSEVSPDGEVWQT